MPLKIVEPPFPEETEGLGPVGNGFDILRPEPARAPLSVPPLLDEAGALEHAQMLGNGRLREPERRSQFCDRCFPSCEAGEDGAPRGIAESRKGAVKINSHMAI